MTTQIKITQLVDIGANLNTTSLFPVVNMAGTPTTQKTNLGNVGNTILQGAGSTFKPAALANLSYSVANAAQPNITSVGTLTTLTVSGNTSLGAVGNVKITGGTSGYVLGTDGAGNLSWVAQTGGGGSYGNSNVATFLASYGSNTITTTGNVSVGNIIGNGQALTGITGANVTGAVSFASTANSVAAANVSGLGNLALLSKDGNASNVLHGDGSWSADLTTYGNSNVASYLPTYTGNLSGGNLSLTGNITSTTQFMSINWGSYHMDFSQYGRININNDFFANANVIGAQYLKGDGSNITNVNAVQVINGTSNVTVPTTNGNVVVTTNGTNQWIFDTTGNLQTPGNIVSPASANFVIYANAGVHEFTFSDDGTFYAPDNVVLGGTSISIGPGANTLTGISNAVFIASSNSTAYIQAAITNVSDIGSADWAAYGHRGDDNGGWIDMGFNSSGYSGTDYTITGPGDGSILVESYYDGQSPGGRGGNLIICTGSQGTVNDIIFGTGGFLIANEFMRISNSNNSLELNRAGANITFPGNLVIAGNTSVFGTNAALIQSTDDLPLIAISSGANGAIATTWVEDIGNIGTSNIAAVYANPIPGSVIVRIAVGQNGGSGPNLWDFNANGVITNPVIPYANLPAPTTPGLRAFISDGNLAPIGNFGVEVSGGGGNYIPVFSDGANWCIG